MLKLLSFVPLVILILIWLISGTITYAGTFAYFQREYPNTAEESYRQDMGFSLMIGLFAPASFIAYGFKFK